MHRESSCGFLYPSIFTGGYFRVNMRSDEGDYTGSRIKNQIYVSCWRPFFASTSRKRFFFKNTGAIGVALMLHIVVLLLITDL